MNYFRYLVNCEQYTASSKLRGAKGDFFTFTTKIFVLVLPSQQVWVYSEESEHSYDVISVTNVTPCYALAFVCATNFANTA